VEKAFEYADLDWKDYVVIDKMFYRPAEVYALMGDYSKSKEKLNWEPELRFDELVKRMVAAEISNIKDSC